MFARFSFLASIIACLALTACSRQEKPVDEGIRAKMLLVGNGVEPRTLDPQLNTGSPEGQIIQTLSEGLVTQDPDDPYGVRPGVAQSWEHDAEFRTWTFHLRQDAKWSDGTALDAQDFLYSWRRILAPELGAELAQLYYPIVGAEDFNQGRNADFSTVGLKAPDPYTIVITAEMPMPYLLHMLVAYPFHPVQRRAVEANGSMTDRANGWYEPGSHVGNGPFVLSQWKTNQFIEVRKNPHYWDAASLKLEAIRFLVIENQKSEVNAFLTGQIHMSRPVPPDQIGRLKKRIPDAIRTARQPNTVFYAVNTGRGALKDQKVRQALSLVIDRKALTENVLLGGQRPLGGMVPFGFPGYPAYTSAPVNADKARRLLAEAGYPDGKGFPAFDILIAGNETNRKLAEAIQAMWKSSLGIDVRIQSLEWKVYLDRLQNRDFDVANVSVSGFYPGPGAYLTHLTSDSPTNFASWKNHRYDALIAQALGTGSSAERNAIYREAEAIMIAQLPIIPLFAGSQTSLVDQRVRGWGPDGAQNFKFVSLSAQATSQDR